MIPNPYKLGSLLSIIFPVVICINSPFTAQFLCWPNIDADKIDNWQADGDGRY